MPGSVIKRGKVWYLRYELPHGPDAPRRQKMLACPGMSKPQAEQKLRDVLSSIHRGDYVEPSEETLADYLSDWLKHRRLYLSPTTCESYDQYMRWHILPRIGQYKLRYVTPAAIQTLYDDLLRSGRRDGRRGGLSPKTVRNIHGLLHSALSHAVRMQLLVRNPTEAVQAPKAPQREMAVLSAEQAVSVIRAVFAAKHRIPMLIAIGTGMRRGEVLGLRWSDFNPVSGELIVRRNVVRVRGETIVKSTKTDRVHAVRLPDSLVEILRRHERSSDWICADADGRLPNPQALATAFETIAHGLGFDVTLHSLRHSQVTILLSEGIPVNTVSERVGHANPSITYNRYSHVVPSTQQKAASVIDSLFKTALKPECEQDVCKDQPTG